MIWMNVTLSKNWARPPVGIVRVEKSLCSILEMQLGSDFGLCVWHEGKFINANDFDLIEKNIVLASQERIVEQSISKDQLPIHNKNRFEPLDLLFRKPKLKNVPVSLSVTHEQSSSSQVVAEAIPTCLKRGDVLISFGLDWEFSYTAQFFKLKNHHGVKVITCCYDLIPVLFPQYCVGDVAKIFSEYFTNMVWGSSHILCISNQTQNDLNNLVAKLGAPNVTTSIITLGDSIPSGDGDVTSEIKELLDDSFILFVSSIERRKNHEVVYRAYHLLANAGLSAKLPKLVFVGMPGWGVADLMKDIELDPLTKGLIIQLNHVSDAELSELYKAAKFCVYPSFYEGWGLPIGEALAMGKLVIASSRGSIPEVGGNYVHYVDPWNPNEWAKVILDYIDNPEKILNRECQIKNGYIARSWFDAAKTVKEIALSQIKIKEDSWHFKPGFDLSTQCGYQHGGNIYSRSLAGILQYGPHLPFNAGIYNLVINAEQDANCQHHCKIDVVSNFGTRVHFTSNLVIKNGRAIYNFDLEQDVQDLEIRIFVDSTISITITDIYLNFKNIEVSDDK